MQSNLVVNYSPSWHEYSERSVYRGRDVLVFVRDYYVFIFETFSADEPI